MSMLQPQYNKNHVGHDNIEGRDLGRLFFINDELEESKQS